MNEMWKPITIDEIPESRRHNGGIWHETVKDFLASGEQAAKIEGGNTVRSLRSCVNNAVRSLNLQSELKVMSRGKDVYLVRRDAE